MEARTQNKLAIIAIFTGIYIGLLTLFTSTQTKSSLVEGITLFVLLAGLIPLIYFFLYLLFLPLRYKSQKKNIFSIDFHDYKIDEVNVDKLFDNGVDWLIPTFIGGFSYYLSLKLTFLLFKDYYVFYTLVFNFLGIYISKLFITKVVKADNLDKNYKVGDGFISLFKKLRRKYFKV